MMSPRTRLALTGPGVSLTTWPKVLRLLLALETWLWASASPLFTIFSHILIPLLGLFFRLGDLVENLTKSPAHHFLTSFYHILAFPTVFSHSKPGRLYTTESPMTISWMRLSDTNRLPSQVQMHTMPPVGQGVVTTVDNSDEKSPEQMLSSKVKLHLSTLGEGHRRTDRR